MGKIKQGYTKRKSDLFLILLSKTYKSLVILITYMYMENSRASRGLESILCKHLAWWKNTVDCLLTVLMKDYLSVLLPAMLYSPSSA